MDIDTLQKIISSASQNECNLMDDEVRVILVDQMSGDASQYLSVIMSNRDDDNWRTVADSFWVRSIPRVAKNEKNVWARSISCAATNEKNVWVRVPLGEINYHVDKPIAIRDEHLLSMATDLIRMRRM